MVTPLGRTVETEVNSWRPQTSDIQSGTCGACTERPFHVHTIH
jgi:hypothetical protein